MSRKQRNMQLSSIRALLGVAKPQKRWIYHIDQTVYQWTNLATSAYGNDWSWYKCFDNIALDQEDLQKRQGYTVKYNAFKMSFNINQSGSQTATYRIMLIRVFDEKYDHYADEPLAPDCILDAYTAPGDMLYSRYCTSNQNIQERDVPFKVLIDKRITICTGDATAIRRINIKVPRHKVKYKEGDNLSHARAYGHIFLGIITDATHTSADFTHGCETYKRQWFET